MLVMGARRATGYVLGRGAGSAAGNGLLTGLVAYWGLDEASGNALDKHSGGLTLTAANAPGANTGKVYATARTFAAASSQYFSRASSATVQAGNIDFALAAWAYLSSKAASGWIVAKRYDGIESREYGIRYLSSTDRYNFFVTPSGTSTGFTSVSADNFGALTLNTWNLIVAWHDATADTINISVNGTANSTAYSSGVYAGNADFRIGAQHDAGALLPWSGRIGPVAFWKNRTLSAADRTLLWNGGAGLAYSAFS